MSLWVIVGFWDLQPVSGVVFFKHHLIVFPGVVFQIPLLVVLSAGFRELLVIPGVGSADTDCNHWRHQLLPCCLPSI